jgi:hypothetical protein
MSVNHCRLEIVARKMLDFSDVVAAFEQMRREGTAEVLASGPLWQSRACDRISESF